MDATARSTGTIEYHPNKEPTSRFDFSGLGVRDRLLIIIAAASAPWALAFGVALLVR